MPLIGFHCSQEQFAPSKTLELASLAEKAGFQGIMTSDHYNPWSEIQGQSAATWSWLGAALAKTNRIEFGSLGIPGGWRYHPTMLAQSIATLCEMFPERLSWVALGSGQNLNEHIVGEGWPDKKTRNARLFASVEVMRALFRGETVNRDDGVLRVRDAKLWSKPRVFPKLFGAALSPETAAWVGGWADGLVTIHQPKEKLEPILEAFRRGGGEGKPMHLQVHVSWDPDEKVARQNAFDHWKTNALKPEQTEEAQNPQELQRHIDEMSRAQLIEKIESSVRISSSLEKHVEWILESAALGFKQIVLHNVGPGQREFIEAFSHGVLPHVRARET